MELKDIMKSFADEIGIEGVVADADGAYHFDIDGIGVTFSTDSDGMKIGMFAEIGEPSSEGREIVYRSVLEAMAPGAGTDGNTFSVMHGSDRIVLYRSDPLALTDYAVFKSRLENLVNVAEDWRRNIADFPSLYGKVQDAMKASADESRKLGQSGFLQV